MGLIGLEGPAAVISGPVAYRLVVAGVLDQVRAAARRDGVILDDETARALDDLHRAAHEHASRRRKQTAVIGSAVVADRTAEDGGSTRDECEWITVAEAARRRGCGPRNVRDLIARGRIPARRSGGRGPWQVDADHVAVG